ncbi:hypothetical protein R3P38DRAFT_3352514 [Favolaschia claudopus]|uniref:Uncharacterized protein n=1 Tax=Favolaschia claudopus TaxID=2862362 RepID=A0AAW0C6S2_9AGAR
MPRLTKAQTRKALAKELALELYNLDVVAGDHCAIIGQATEEQVAEAYARGAVGRRSFGSMPPPDQMQAAIALAERDLEVVASTLKERMDAVASAMFLAQVKMMLGAKNDFELVKEVSALRVALHDKRFANHPPPHQLPPATIPTPAAQDLEPDYPELLPASTLRSMDFRNATRLPLKRVDINKYRRNPDPLLNASQFFVSKKSGNFYKVSSIVCTPEGKLFYLTFADEGSAGMCYTSEDFFELLSDSCKVQI